MEFAFPPDVEPPALEVLPVEPVFPPEEVVVLPEPEVLPLVVPLEALPLPEAAPPVAVPPDPAEVALEPELPSALPALPSEAALPELAAAEDDALDADDLDAAAELDDPELAGEFGIVVETDAEPDGSSAPDDAGCRANAAPMPTTATMATATMAAMTPFFLDAAPSMGAFSAAASMPAAAPTASEPTALPSARTSKPPVSGSSTASMTAVASTSLRGAVAPASTAPIASMPSFPRSFLMSSLIFDSYPSSTVLEQCHPDW